MITMKTLIATLVAAVALTFSAGAAMNSDKSHRVRSDDYEANLRRALRYEAEENYGEQLACLQKCLSKKPDDPAALNSLAMAYLNLDRIAEAEKTIKKLKGYESVPCVRDTFRQIAMVKAEGANPNAAPVVSNVLQAADCAYRNNREVGNAPLFQLKSVTASEDRGKPCWRGSYLTVTRSDFGGGYPVELSFKVYPSGRVAIGSEKPGDGLGGGKTVKFSYYNYRRYFQLVKPDLTGVTTLEDPDDGKALLCLKAGTKVVRAVTIGDLFRTGAEDLKARVGRSDKVVIRDGGVHWDAPTDKDPVLLTLTNRTDVAAFSSLFEFDPGSDKTPLRIGQPCRCEGGPGIDWWCGGEKLAQTALHHGSSLWWDGFTWDFFVTDTSRSKIAAWLSTHGVDLSKFGREEGDEAIEADELED